MPNFAANDFSNWREFERNDVTHSAAHYLMAIKNLRAEFGYARVTDVAERLEVSRGAASMALGQLKRRGLVTEDPHRFLLLTEEGTQLAEQVERNFAILSRFFVEMLGISPDIAQADACKMEHLMSFETGRRMLTLMEFMLSDPGRAEWARKGMAEQSLKEESRDA